MNIEISKVELSGRVFLKYEYAMTERGRKTKIKASADAPIHDDLATAIQGLVPHFVLLTEMKKKAELAKVIDLKELPEELLSKFKVTGLSIEDSKGDISYKISGLKFLNTGKTVSFESPKIRESATDDEEYEFIDALIEKVEEIKEEVLEYIGGKEAERVQKSMEFGEDFNPEVDGDEATHEFAEHVA